MSYVLQVLVGRESEYKQVGLTGFQLGLTFGKAFWETSRITLVRLECVSPCLHFTPRLFGGAYTLVGGA